MGGQAAAAASPHVLIFPLPLQGPVNCMLKLAEILTHEGITVTFLNSHHIHHRLPNIPSLSAKYPNLRFQTLPDGLPRDNPRTGDQILNLLQSMEAVSMPIFRDILASSLASDSPVTCLIADGVFTFAADVASQLAIPLLYFDTISPCGLWSLLCLPQLIQAGEVPFGDDKLDEMARKMPGMEGIMRYRDLPSFCRIKEVDDPIIQLVIKEANHIPMAQGLIFNTFQQLEAPILTQMRSICSNVYAVGPLHTHLRSRVAGAAATSNSIWEEDNSCISWLDKQPSKSVIYVSVGSLAVMTKQQLYEIWHGLVNSGSRFLWVQRPGSVSGSGSDPEEEGIPLDLLQGTKERGYIVSWAPQEEVLAHPAVGGFFTHCGWNSTLESMTCGKPMICWPFHADQQVNSRYVGEVWKVGLDMKDRCDRVLVEKMIRELRKDEFLKRAETMAELAESSVSHGGSSFMDLDRLIQDIKMMKLSINHS